MCHTCGACSFYPSLVKKEKPEDGEPSDERWSVWLVRGNGALIEKFSGGEVSSSWDIVGIYKTAEETKHYRADQVDLYGKVLVPPLHDDPIAWLVRAPEDGCGLYVGASGGGPVRKPSEDYLSAVYQTREEAESYIAAKEAAIKAHFASVPDWRTLPDNCANCGHPASWHMGEGQCILEDDLDSHGNWTLCLKACLAYEHPATTEPGEL